MQMWRGAIHAGKEKGARTRALMMYMYLQYRAMGRNGGGEDGPGKLCQALGIDRRFDGTDLTTSLDLYLAHSGSPAPMASAVIAAPRIGIDYAEEWTAKPLRFCLKDNVHLSVKPPLR